MILGAAEGIPNRVLARKLSTSLPTVLLWRRRYEGGGLPGIVEDRPRSGRPKQISPEQEAAIVNATLKTTPKDATHWSVRAMAHRQKVSPATVHRIWKKHKLQPHRVDSFKFSNDPDFAYKVRDIVGLYLKPPAKAIVLSVDEKSQIQALDRTQRFFRCGPDCLSGKHMTTNGMERRRYLPHSTCSKGPSSVNVSRDIAIRSSWHFSGGSTTPLIRIWTYIWCSTTTELTNTPK